MEAAVLAAIRKKFEKTSLQNRNRPVQQPIITLTEHRITYFTLHLQQRSRTRCVVTEICVTFGLQYFLQM